MSRTKQINSPPRPYLGRPMKVGNWVESLEQSDAGQIWTDLHRIASRHPLVRASKRAGFLVEEGNYNNAYADLTQELFVALLSKDRFRHYLESSMTSVEVEAEISQIELTNMLTSELRKQHPESYRLARRISTLVQSSPRFKRFDNDCNPASHMRLTAKRFGLADWKYPKMTKDGQEMDERVKTVSFFKRDTRMVGRTGTSQVVISNIELEKLIVRVFKAIDSPVNIRTLRSFVMSRLPIMDIHLVSVGGSNESDDDDRKPLEIVDKSETPEENLLRSEGENGAAGYVDNFLLCLNKSVRGKRKQYDRMLSVLWHCYLTSDNGTQIEVAGMLGVSDSLVSDYRKRIESSLQQLSFSSVNEARHFEKALKYEVRKRIETGEAIALA